MSLQFPNRTGQSASYHVGTPNYVDVDSTGSTRSGMQTFASAATADSWAAGDTVTVEVFKDADNWWVGLATWDATNEYLELTSEEDSKGSLADLDAVSVTAVPTRESFLVVSRGVEMVEEISTARTLASSDHGHIVRCVSSGATTITLADTLPVGFHALISQEGEGAVSVQPAGADTLNGSTDPVTVVKRYGAAYLYRPAPTVWVLLA